LCNQQGFRTKLGNTQTVNSSARDRQVRRPYPITIFAIPDPKLEIDFLGVWRQAVLGSERWINPWFSGK
jgi:hypothetical protein